MNRRLWIVIALTVGSAVGVGCAVFASKSEYAAYREYRIADGRDAQLHRLIPDRVVINDVSAQDLVDAILGTGRYYQPWPSWYA